MASRVRGSSGVGGRVVANDIDEIAIIVEDFLKVIAGVAAEAVSVGGIMTLAEVGDGLTDSVGAKEPVFRAGNADSVFPGVAAAVGRGGSVGGGEVAGDIHNVAVGVLHLRQVVAGIAAGTPAVGKVVGRAVGGHGVADSVSAEDVELRASLADTIFPGMATFIGHFLHRGADADSIIKIVATVAGGAASFSVVGSAEGGDLGANAISIAEPEVRALFACLRVPVPDLTAKHGGGSCVGG